MKVNPTTEKAIGLMMIVLFLLSSAVFCQQKNVKCTKPDCPNRQKKNFSGRAKYMLKVKKIKLNKIGIE